MDLNSLIQELGQRLGMDGLALDENHSCRLLFDGKIAVQIEKADDDEFFIHSVVDRIPSEGQAACFEALLDANFLCQKTGHAFFSIDKTDGEILLQQRFSSAGTDAQAFVNELEIFVNVVESWMESLAADPGEKQHPGSDPVPGGVIMG